MFVYMKKDLLASIKQSVGKLFAEPYLQGNYKTGKVNLVVGLFEIPLTLEEENMFQEFAPDVFSWGCDCPGASKLAMTILSIYLPSTYVLDHYTAFKKDMITSLPKKDFEFSIYEVEEWLRKNFK